MSGVRQRETGCEQAKRSLLLGAVTGAGKKVPANRPVLRWRLCQREVSPGWWRVRPVGQIPIPHAPELGEAGEDQHSLGECKGGAQV